MVTLLTSLRSYEREKLKRNDAVDLVGNSVYQRDALTVNSEEFDCFNGFLSTRRRSPKSLKN